MSDIRILGGPRRYIQGPGALAMLQETSRELGARAVLVADPLAWRQEAAHFAWLAPDAVLAFGGEITAAEIDRLAAGAAGRRADVVIAFGGGKAIDAAKGVALAHGLPIVVAPSIASNDAPTSRVIVVYDAQHRIAGIRRLQANPDVVIADTRIIARAPRRFLAAGIGDALSKTFEASACHAAGGLNFHGGRPPLAALALARACHETIRGQGLAALAAVDAKTPDAALEDVVEACILMSGLGFESGGLSLAHALTRGFAAHPATAHALHGEVVAFGAIAQRVQEEHPETEIRDMIRFVRACGLPASLAELGLADACDEDLARIVEPTLGAPYVRHLAAPPDARRLAAVLRRCDALASDTGPGMPDVHPAMSGARR